MSTFNQTNDYMSYQNNQPDFIDQATKVLDFVDRIGQRNPVQAPSQTPYQAPSNQPSQYNVGNFQSRSAQDFANQELRFNQNYLNNSNVSIQSKLNKALKDNALLIEAVTALLTENEAIYKYADALYPFFITTPVLNAEIEALEHTLAMVVPFVAIADARTNEMIETEKTLDLICYTISDPDFLIYYAFKQWRNSINADSEAALSWIADEWLKLISKYNRKYREKYNQPSPTEQSLQPRNNYTMQSSSYGQERQFSPPPMPPIPSYNQGANSPIDALKNKIDLLKNGGHDLAANLQRQHTMSRQANNPNNMELYL